LAAPVVVIIRRCTSEMRPCGNSTTRSTLSGRQRHRPRLAPPVSPEVATTEVVALRAFAST